MPVTAGAAQLRREHFIRNDLDKEHYYYSFGIPGLEICMEPCAAGFDVAIYTDNDGIPQYEKSAIEPKRCTETGDYTQIDALFGDRKDEDWNKALEIANELFDKFADKFVRDRYESRVWELLDQPSKEKVCACYTEGQSLCGNKHSMNTIIHANVTCPACLAILRQQCMFCGCTDDHACPGGCSWVELNVCSRCKDRLNGNELISGEEIKALRRRAKTITMKEGLRLRMQGGFVPVIPMDLKSGYGISLTIVENPPDRNPIEILSVGAIRGRPDPADSESIATAVLGKGYAPLPSLLPSKRMVHFWKRREG